MISGEVTMSLSFLLVPGIWHCLYHWVDLVDYLFGDLVFMTQLFCWCSRCSHVLQWRCMVIESFSSFQFLVTCPQAFYCSIWGLMTYGLFVWWIVTVHECTCASSYIPNWQQAFQFQLRDSSFHNQIENVMHKILGTSPGHVSDTGLNWFYGVCSHQLSILLVG